VDKKLKALLVLVGGLIFALVCVGGTIAFVGVTHLGEVSAIAFLVGVALFAFGIWRNRAVRS
jgi:hypothetical protein